MEAYRDNAIDLLDTYLYILVYVYFELWTQWLRLSDLDLYIVLIDLGASYRLTTNTVNCIVSQ
mgnify:CR=1 FL=1